MNHELKQLIERLPKGGKRHERLRFAFGIVCADHARHLLERQQVIELLDVGLDFVNGLCDKKAVAKAAADAAALASSHPGSQSIDGSGHAAVSATYAVANALAGRCLDAAEYAAYASVYSYGGYAAAEPSAYAEAYAWQVRTIREMANSEGVDLTPANGLLRNGKGSSPPDP